MRTHTSQFKNELKNMGRQIDSIITYGNTTLHDELYAVTPHFEASLLKSVMKQLDIESSVIIPIGTTVNYQLGVKVGNAYEYMNYGNYVVYSIEKIEDTDTYKMICYDKMLYSMKEYESLGVTYPINIRNFINALCTKVGLVFKDTATQFANYDKIIENELYLDVDGNSLGYTYRDVFDELAQVTASIICIDPATDKVQIKYPNQTNDTIDEEFLKDVNVKFGEKYGPVNTIVLSRSAGADNVYYPDPLPQNPCEIKITDNQIMNWNDRDIYLPDIYNKLNGLEYYINNFSSTGILYYELGDFYNVSVGSTTYKCLMLNDEINVTQGIEELIHTEILEEAQTDYTKADKTDRRINQTYFIVNKQNQKIEAVINTTQEIEHQFETLQDIDGFAEGKYIYLDDASDELITSAKFNGETSQETRSGKNLLGLTNGTYTNRGITAVVTNGIITLSGTSNDSSYASIIDIPLINPISSSVETVIKSLNPTGTYTGVQTSLRASNVETSVGLWSNNAENKSGTLSGNAYYLRIQINYNVTVNCTLKAQVESGTTATDFEQYGVMPSPDYPSEIENLEGKNLFDEVLENGGFDTNGINGANAARIRSKNYISIKENTSYTISVGENNTGKTLQVSMSFYDTNDYVTPRIFYISWTTLNKSVTFTTPANCKYMRFLISYTDSSAITINDNFNKFMIKKGTDITPYVPYNSLEVKVVNKNIFDLKTFLTERGVTYTENNDGSLTFTIISSLYTNPLQFSQEDTTVSLSGIVTNGTSNNARIHLLNSSNQNMGNIREGSTALENVSACKLRFDYNSGGSGTVTMKNIQLEKGEPTDYEEHQEQIVYFPLAEGQKLYEGSYLADDGIHNKIRELYLAIADMNNAENYPGWTNQEQLKADYPNINNTFLNAGISCIGNISNDADKFGINTTGVGVLYLGKTRWGKTQTQWKTDYPDLVLQFQYELPEEEIIPYNTEQQAAWNNIKSLHTYKTVTHIYSDAYAEIGYIKDNMLSAFETKASAQLTKNDVSQLKIENGRISSEVSSTQSQLNNYYTKNEADNNTNSTKAELQNIIQQNKTEIEQTTQAINLRVSSIETNGVDKIETSMGYTFNNDGLNIDKDGAATASTIDNEAFKVKNKSTNENVFFAGYVSDQDSAYRGQTIVESTNLVVKNYLNIEGASRFQPYVNPVLGGHGTGAFDIG